jgi:hypothetical protein
MDTATKKVLNTNPVVTKEYFINGTKYIVTASARDGATQDAASIIRRLIRKDILSKS